MSGSRTDRRMARVQAGINAAYAALDQMEADMKLLLSGRAACPASLRLRINKQHAHLLQRARELTHEQKRILQEAETPYPAVHRETGRAKPRRNRHQSDDRRSS